MINFLRKIKKKMFPQKLDDRIDVLRSNKNIGNPEDIVRQIDSGDRIIKYSYKNHTLHIFNELATIYHITNSTEKLEKLASCCMPNDAGVCLDIGANVGLFSYFYKYYNPACTIHLFEPDNRLLPIIKLNLISFENYFIHNIALSNVDGEGLLYVNHQSSQTNSKHRVNVAPFGREEDIKEMTTQTSTLKTFLESTNISKISCLKIDVQGAEFEILSSSPEILEVTEQLLVEVSFMMEDAIPTLNLVHPYYKNSKPINSVLMGADIKFYN